MFGKSNKYNILVLTDGSTHALRDAIFPLLYHLHADKRVGRVCVADRQNPQNKNFFRYMNAAAPLHCCTVDSSYSYETHPGKPCEAYHLRDFDALWLRISHPVSDVFLKFIARSFSSGAIINHPLGLIAASSKAYLLDLHKQLPVLGHYLPPMHLCNSVKDIMSFAEVMPAFVLKPLRNYGGQGILRFGTDIENTSDLDIYLKAHGGSCLAVEYQNVPQQCDRRTVIFRGEIIGSLDRHPGPGGWLCNVHAGGSAVSAEPDLDEIALIDLIDPVLQSLRIYLYGIDTLKGNRGTRILSEINTLNVGGMTFMESYTGTPVTKRCAEIFLSLVDRYWEDKEFSGIVFTGAEASFLPPG